MIGATGSAEVVLERGGADRELQRSGSSCGQNVGGAGRGVRGPRGGRCRVWAGLGLRLRLRLGVDAGGFGGFETVLGSGAIA